MKVCVGTSASNSIAPPYPGALRDYLLSVLNDTASNHVSLSREYILSKWTAKDYAESLKKGLLSIHGTA